MSEHYTTVMLDVKYHIETFKVGQEVLAFPVIESVNGNPADQKTASIIINALWNDDDEFNEAIEWAKEMGKEK
jgi:hypothetical protein